MEKWRSLIGRAIERLEGIGLDRHDWVWGGGTVLMLRYQHRQSKDVDLFINDVQFLSYLSPRLNERGTVDLQHYEEQANHLRLEYPEGEVDFLAVAPVFPDLKPVTTEVEGIVGEVQLMPDKEILGQKLHYRAAGFTGRDLYDFVAVTKANPALLHDKGLLDVARNRRDALEVSIKSPACAEGYGNVIEPSLKFPFATARAILFNWIDGRDPQPEPEVDTEPPNMSPGM